MNKRRYQPGRYMRSLATTVLVAFFCLQVSNAAYGQFAMLAWDPNPESHLSGYNVYRSQQPGVFGSTPLNGTTPLSSTAFTDATVQSGSTYYYVVRSISLDGIESVNSSEVQAIVPAAISNKAPVVSAGTNLTITLPSQASLTATATDDGLPGGSLTYAWSVVGGSGVTFSSPASKSTMASFSTSGNYVLRVTAGDGQLTSTADVSIEVLNAAELKLLVSKGGELLRGAVTSVTATYEDSRVEKLDLYINQSKVSSVSASSLTYRWDLRKLSGQYTIQARAYGSNNVLLKEKALTVTIQ